MKRYLENRVYIKVLRACLAVGVLASTSCAVTDTKSKLGASINGPVMDAEKVRYASVGTVEVQGYSLSTIKDGTVKVYTCTKDYLTGLVDKVKPKK